MNSQQSRAEQLVSFAVRLYCRMLHWLPAHFRAKYAGEMCRLFADLCHDAFQRAGLWGVARVWMRALPDLAFNAIAEHIRQWKLGNYPNWSFAAMKRLTFATRLFPVLGLCLLAYSGLFVLANLLIYELGLTLPFEPYAITATGTRGELLRALRDLAIIGGPMLAVVLFILPYLRIELGGNQRWLTTIVRPLPRVALVSSLLCVTVLGVLFTYLLFENLPCLLGQQLTC